MTGRSYENMFLVFFFFETRAHEAGPILIEKNYNKAKNFAQFVNKNPDQGTIFTLICQRIPKYDGGYNIIGHEEFINKGLTFTFYLLLLRAKFDFPHGQFWLCHNVLIFVVGTEFFHDIIHGTIDALGTS
ncbi:hypothetical protein ACJX0J_026224, partial [Zea mays]